MKFSFTISRLVKTPTFEPNIKTTYDFNKLALRLEYYGSLGQLNQIPAVNQQSHALVVVADLFADPEWEVNVGPGWGLTKATDAFVLNYWGAGVLAGRRQ